MILKISSQLPSYFYLSQAYEMSTQQMQNIKLILSEPKVWVSSFGCWRAKTFLVWNAIWATHTIREIRQQILTLYKYDNSLFASAQSTAFFHDKEHEKCLRNSNHIIIIKAVHQK